MHRYRSHTCGALRDSDIGQTVRLSGWCHVIRDHEPNKESYSGPRFLMRIAELDMHPLDTVDRRDVAVDDHGLGFCNITKCCTEVCPEGIKITDNALIPLKERVVDKRYDPVFSVGSLFRKGQKRSAPPT